MSCAEMPSTAETSPQRAIQLLYSDHHRWLRGWLLRKVGCPFRAEDLAHDSFERVLRSPQLRLADALREPRAFLVTTARRLLIDDARRRRIEQHYLQQLLAQAPEEAGDGSLEEWMAVVESLTAIARLLDGLPARTRAAFLMYRFDGLQQAEIATRLGVSPTRVKQYIAQVMVHCHAIAYGEGSR